MKYIKKIITIVFYAIAFLSFDIQEEAFFSDESTCNFIYTVDKKTVLKLREKEKFMITIQVKDSRYSKATNDSISGKFLRICDTLMFQADYASEKYLLKHVHSFSYVYKKDSLLALKNSFFLPNSFVKQK